MSDTKNRICKSDINSAKNDRKIRGGKIKYGIIRNTKNTRQEEIIISTKQISILFAYVHDFEPPQSQVSLNKQFQK